MDLSSYWRKKPLCEFSWSYDDCYYIDFMVRTASRITDVQTDRQTHPQTTARVSVETCSTRWNHRIQKALQNWFDFPWIFIWVELSPIVLERVTVIDHSGGMWGGPKSPVCKFFLPLRLTWSLRPAPLFQKELNCAAIFHFLFSNRG